ncbi:hypothetical protein AAC387_Pa04g2802 [Persea americana]
MKMESSEELKTLYRICFWRSEGFHLIRVLSCILLLAMCGPCATRNHLVSCADGMRSSLDYDACQSYTDNDASLPDLLFSIGDISSDHGQKSLARCFDLKHVCANTNFFCFPSTLSVFLSEDGNCEQAIFKVPEYSDDSRSVSVPHDIGESNSSWFAAHATYKLLNGRMVSCSLNPVGEIRDQLPPQHSNVDQTTCKGPLLPTSIPDKNSKVAESDILDGSSSPHVAISPPLLDWGQNNLYAPSLAFLTVTNTCNDSILHVYEPFSTNPQFYSYNFEEMSLAPGESASLSFVFLPRWLGSSSAHLVLQTSLGGFLIHAKGRASGSPYGIQPLVGLDILSDGGLTKSFSLYNPFDSALFVVELAAWIAISSANTSDTAQAVCTIDALGATDEFSSILDDKEWLNVKGSELGFPMMGIRPFGHWQVDPRGTEPIMEMKLLPHVEGKVFGALCMQLQSSSMDRTDTVIVPLEAETHRRVAYTSLTGSVSAFFDSVKACDEKGSIASALSLRNGASHILSVVKISELTESKKLFQVKYMEGLVLFPGTITHIAVIIYTPHDDSQDSRPELPSISSDCKLLIMTNDSFSPQIEIPCLDIVLNYLGHNPGSASAAAPETSYIGLEFQREQENTENSKTGSLGSNIQVSPSVKVSEIAEVDELILRNWKSHGSTSGMSVLEEDIVLFPTVKVRTHSSRRISVSNPSGKPVVMQLVLNAGAIVDQCRDSDESLEHTLSTSFVCNDSMVARDGFAIDETAITEAYVPPYGKALLGPIIFSPSNRCVWRSSALIRNNLSGVEWLHLQGFGGSISLLLLEGSEPIRNLEFNFDLPIPINVSSPELSFHMEATKAACSRPLSKVIYAKNVGDMPLEVRKIEVSGADCGSDGFVIHTCKGFALEPGESTRLLISYQTDFSASVVHRDLELALAAGILVVPMKAILPVYMLSLCRKSFFWTLLRKLSVIVLFAASVTFLLFYRIIPQSVASFGQDYLFKTEKNPIATISRADKLLRPHRNQKNSRLVKEAENSEIGFVSRYSNSPNSVKEVGITAQPVQHKQNNQVQVIDRLHLQMKTSVSQSPMEKSVAEIEGLTILETPPPTDNLTVRTQKEKRRRKKRAAGTCSGITGKFEVSSSQSGNSTPSSPISPVASSTPKRLWPLSSDIDHSVRAPEHLLTIAQNQRCEKEQAFKAAIEAKLQEPDTNIKSFNNSWLLSVNEQPFIPKEKVSKPVLLPSATFPGPGWRGPGSVGNSPFLSSPSVIAPHARAPGSKVSKEEPMKIKEKVRSREEFTYDIWGNHFSEFHLMGRQNDSPKVSDVFEGESQSFFAKGPQSLIQKLPEISVSPTPKLERPVPSVPALPIYAVNSLHHMSN